MSASNVLVFTSLLVFAYLVTPTVLGWGWARLIKQPPQKWTISAVLSFVAFLLASASSLFALCVILYAEGGGIRAHPQRRKLFTRFQVLLPMHSRGCRFVALEYRVFNWRCLAAELFALARSCKRNRNACLLAASDDMALISMENGLNRLKASFSFQFLPVCRPFGN